MFHLVLEKIIYTNLFFPTKINKKINRNLYFVLFFFPHTEYLFLNLVKSNQTWIVIKIFLLIYQQSKFRVDPKINRKSVITIYILCNKPRFRKLLQCVHNYSKNSKE